MEPWTRVAPCEGYDAGTFFHVQAYRVRGIRGLHEFLRRIAKDPRLFVIRGEPTDEVRASIEAHRELRRKERAAARGERVDWSDLDRLERLERKTFRRLLKPKADSPATFRAVPRRWSCFDIDDEPLPAGLDVAADPEGVIRYLLSLLPAELQDVTVVVQFSASAGLKPGTVSAHLWFWLAEPATTERLKLYAASCCDRVRFDPTPFGAVQPIYTAAPLFEGVDDPMRGRRIFLVEGERDVVTLPPPEATRRRVERVAREHKVDAGRLVDLPAGWREKLALRRRRGRSTTASTARSSPRPRPTSRSTARERTARRSRPTHARPSPPRPSARAARRTWRATPPTPSSTRPSPARPEVRGPGGEQVADVLEGTGGQADGPILTRDHLLDLVELFGRDEAGVDLILRELARADLDPTDREAVIGALAVTNGVPVEDLRETYAGLVPVAGGADPRQALLDRYVYVEGIERFVDVEGGELLTERQLDKRHVEIGSHTARAKCASAVYLHARGRRRMAHDLTYRPGRGAADHRGARRPAPRLRQPVAAVDPRPAAGSGRGRPGAAVPRPPGAAHPRRRRARARARLDGVQRPGPGGEGEPRPPAHRRGGDRQGHRHRAAGGGPGDGTTASRSARRTWPTSGPTGPTG